MTAIPRRPAQALAAMLLSASVTAGAAATAGAASAAAITVDRACYVNVNPAVGAPMTVTGIGYAPGETVDVSGGNVLARATAHATGAFSVTTQAPILATVNPSARPTKLTATGETSRTMAAITVQSANLAVQSVPGSVRNVRRNKVRFSFSGFTPGKHIYGFYMRRRFMVRTRFGIATGPCGTLTQRALLFPGGRPKHNQYNVAFESSPRYSRTAFPKITGKLNILRF